MLPNVAAMQLEDEQVSIGGLTMGQGTPYIITEFNPWDAAEVTATDVGLGARPGVVSGINVYKSRPVSFRVFIPASEDGKPGTAQRSSALRTAMAPSNVDIPLHFRIGGVTYFAMGRPRMVKGDTKRWGAGHLSFECRFLATDPRIYRSELQAQNLLLAVTSTSGMRFPLDLDPALDLRHGADLAIPPITCFNDGTVPASWQIVITATPDGIGAGGISVYSAETGRALSLPNISLAPGSTLYLDSSEHSVLTTAGSNYVVARQYLSADSTWWDLQVGTNSILVNIGSGAAEAVIYWYPAEV